MSTSHLASGSAFISTGQVQWGPTLTEHEAGLPPPVEQEFANAEAAGTGTAEAVGGGRFPGVASAAGVGAASGVGVAKRSFYTASGTFEWAAADTVSTIKTISPGFEAKVVLLFIGGNLDSDTDLIQRVDPIGSVGIILNKATPKVRAMASMRRSSSAGTQAWGTIRDDSCAIQVTNNNFTGTVGRLGDPVIDSTDVDIEVLAQGDSDVRVHWIAYGGEDLQNYEVVTAAAPGSTGDFDITGFGFTPRNSDCLALLFGSRNAGGAMPISQNGFSKFFGVAHSSFQAVISKSDSGTSTAIPVQTGHSGECLNYDDGSQTDVGARASFSQWIEGGLRLNFAEVSGSGSAFFVLIMQGPQWAAGELTVPASTGTFSAVSGLGFQPRGLVFAHAGRPETTAGTLDTDAGGNFGMGFATGYATGTPTHRVAATGNEATTGRARVGVDYDSVLILANDAESNTITATVDIDIDADGFTPDKTVDAGLSFNEPWFFWFAAGDAEDGKVHLIRTYETAEEDGADTITDITIPSVDASDADYLIVGVTWRDSASQTISSITHNGVSLTEITTKLNAAGGAVHTFRLYAPSGIGDLVVTLSAGVRNIQVGAALFSGVHQSSGEGTIVTGSASSGTTTTTGSASGDANGYFWDVIGVRGGPTDVSPGLSQTQRTDQLGSASMAHGTSTALGAASDTLDWTWSPTNGFVHQVVPILPAGGGGIEDGAGSSTGTSTATAVGASTRAGAGSASGVGVASGVLRATATMVASAAGTSTATAVGQRIVSGAGSAAGTSTATAVGASISAGVGSAAGTSTVSGVLRATASMAASATGTGTATGVLRATATMVASASGTGVASGVLRATGAGVGNAAGTSTATAESQASNIQSGAGSAVGTSTVSGVGRAFASGVGASTGTSTVSGALRATASTVATAAGAGQASGVGRARTAAIAAAVGLATAAGILIATAAGVGNAAGSALASGFSSGQVPAVASAAGTSTVSGVGRSTAAGAGSSAGTCTVTATGQTIKAAVGSASGLSTCSAVGRSTAAGVGNAAGTSTVTGQGATVGGSIASATGTSTVTGVGRSTASTTASATGTSTVTASSQAFRSGAGTATGTSTATGVSSATSAAVGSAVGTSTATGVLRATAAGVGNAVGTTTVNGLSVPLVYGVTFADTSLSQGIITGVSLRQSEVSGGSLSQSGVDDGRLIG